MAAAPTSLTANVTALDAGAPVTAAAFIGGAPAFALGDGQILLGGGDDARLIAAHPDAAILIAVKAGERLITGGDDGRVVEIAGDGAMRELAREKGKWIDALAARADGAVAWSTGRQVFARDAKGDVKAFTAPSTVRGLAFLPKGYRLAISHYNGASLWFPNAAAEPDELHWKGSHLEITASPDGKFIVTSMQENALHAWRLSDKKDLRLSGYPAKPRSTSWSHDGNWLATSGAEAAIVWPFNSKEGPVNKAPRELGVRSAKVTMVAFHPKSPILAQGYEDGMILLCRQADGAELLVRAEGAGAITALAWDQAGRRLLFGGADGAAGLLTMPA
ncbi:WD-40 repeat protein [Methylocella silvestris BL2]|uniref:WD-40 repeat protein n=1 Tax=Methylocella silvestris (strain DSM 15510 / CIP 108128 / LMG 27833 / NCIMB 13906 / BL2) TaxID=395965 RepID=B8EKQ3_METSB|nr:WD40 repeat domain-containing protein [Methylocella silvestris]ACK51931.1 WD-40 repeat protein [Methylocella silvestris BL2]